MRDTRAIAAAKASVETSKVSFSSAMSLWDGAKDPEAKEKAATAVVSNAGSWEALMQSVPQQAEAIWTAAGKPAHA